MTRRANSTQVEPLSSHSARRLHRLAGRSAWWGHGQVRPGARILGGRPPGANPLGPLQFSPTPAHRRLPVDPLRASRRRLVSRKIGAAERLYLGGTCSRDGLPRFSARSVRCRDAGHRKAGATPSGTLAESLGKPPFRSRRRPVGGRRKALTMGRIAGRFPPTRRAACAISTGHYRRSLV
jgi:hypothetical protein